MLARVTRKTVRPSCAANPDAVTSRSRYGGLVTEPPSTPWHATGPPPPAAPVMTPPVPPVDKEPPIPPIEIEPPAPPVGPAASQLAPVWTHAASVSNRDALT